MNLGLFLTFVIYYYGRVDLSHAPFSHTLLVFAFLATLIQFTKVFVIMSQIIQIFVVGDIPIVGSFGRIVIQPMQVTFVTMACFIMENDDKSSESLVGMIS